MTFDIDPTIGRVGGSIWAHAPSLSDPAIGRSRAVVPIINRIDVDDKPKKLARMGAIAKRVFFADYPAFIFNVCFAVGDFSLLLWPGSYGDPHSHWFNVFMGYYQLDVPKRTWNRPFAYASATANAEIAFHDIIRLGKSDWNYFSNYMYGVPEDCIEPYNEIDFSATPCLNLGRQTIGDHSWDYVEVDQVIAVSSYESNASGSRRLVNNSLLSPMWRRTFGLPCPSRDYPESFISTMLTARMYLSFSEDRDYYHTVIFGGTVNKSFPAALNGRFLDLQMESCARVMTKHYPQLGFPIH